ncbi:uncharacterized protein LOC144132546 isoform X3 [Amblyomma americanum]
MPRCGSSRFRRRNNNCKHIVASLLHINAARTFDKLSPTDHPQKWNKAQKEKQYEPRAILDLPCAKRQRSKILLNLKVASLNSSSRIWAINLQKKCIRRAKLKLL